MDYDKFLKETLEKIEQLKPKDIEKICIQHGYFPIPKRKFSRLKCFFNIHVNNAIAVEHYKTANIRGDLYHTKVTYKCSCCKQITYVEYYNIGHLTLEEVS